MAQNKYCKSKRCIVGTCIVFGLCSAMSTVNNTLTFITNVSSVRGTITVTSKSLIM